MLVVVSYPKNHSYFILFCNEMICIYLFLIEEKLPHFTIPSLASSFMEEL